jgi:hypothetical protein
MIGNLISFIPGGQIAAGAFSFLKSPLGIAAICFSVGWFAGYRHMDKAAEIAALQNENATLKIDLTISRQAEDLSRKQADFLDALVRTNKETVDALAADLEKISEERRSCALTDDQRRRLLNIR